MNISHDKESGALYIRLRDGEYDHTEDLSGRADVYLDVDRAGNVLGLEALSFEDLAQAIEESGGRLEVPDRLGAFPDDRDPDPEAVREAISSLEPRERELMAFVAEGLPIGEIADRLGISVVEVIRLRRSAFHNVWAEVYRTDAPEDDRSIEDALRLRR